MSDPLITAARQRFNWGRVSAYILMAALTVAVGTVVFWVNQPGSVLVVNNDPTPVKPPEVQADGGVITLTVDFCKNRRLEGKSKVYLVGETKGQKPEISWPIDTSPKQCVVVNVPVNIPASTQTDTYHVVFEVTYKVNPLKNETVIFRSRSFKVINQKLQPGDAKPVVP